MKALNGAEEIFSSRGGYTDRKQWSLDHAREVFQDAKQYDEVFDCVMVTKAKQNEDLICNPIYKFTELDVWRYIEENSIEVNPLYGMGYMRVGCVMCPLGGTRSMLKEAADFPKHKQAYIRSFNRMLEARRRAGMKTEWKDGEEVFEWWVYRGKKIKDQESLFT